MKGKDKCKILKDIRRRIAEANDIEYVTKECEHKGDCKGTCPRCESEIRYLEEQLEKRRMSGKKIAVAAIATGILFTSAGCDFFDRGVKGDVPYEPELMPGDVPYVVPETDPEDIGELEGDVVYEPELIGDVPYTPEENEEEPELMGAEEIDILEEDATCEVHAE